MPTGYGPMKTTQPPSHIALRNATIRPRLQPRHSRPTPRPRARRRLRQHLLRRRRAGREAQPASRRRHRPLRRRGPTPTIRASRPAPPRPEWLDPAAPPRRPSPRPQSLCPGPPRPVRSGAFPRGCWAWPRAWRWSDSPATSASCRPGGARPTPEPPLVSAVRRATLRITVTERGNLESCVTVDGICEVNANQIKIISLVPEGTKVKKGEIVCKFDSSEIDKNIAQQDIKVKQARSKIETTQQEMEIQRNKGESDIIAAKVELTLAELDLEKYQKGDYPAETTKQKGEIGLKKKDLEEAEEQARPVPAAHEEGVQVARASPDPGSRRRPVPAPVREPACSS